MAVAMNASTNTANSMNARGRLREKRYHPPPSDEVGVAFLRSLLESCGRRPLQDRQLNFLSSGKVDKEVEIFFAGGLTALEAPCVAIVGTREVSDNGLARAKRLARELVKNGVTVISGLARGVDTAAHVSAIESGGRTVAVIGTPLSQAYPAENSELQEAIYREHLLISPFAENERVFKGNFPKRNRVMAALSDATVIIEASDTSGTLHQAAECQRLGRWLFIAKSVVEDRTLRWPSKFIGKPKVSILEKTEDIIDVVGNH